MFGKNKILKPQNHDGSSLQVQEIFATFQGEGPYVGYPSVFVRLGGCNLACDFCDTEFDSFAEISVEKIVEKVVALAGSKQSSSAKITSRRARELVVITGGEPFRQPIERLCAELLACGFLVQIETNGTLFRKIPREVKIICSPKNTGTLYHKIRPDLLEQLDAIKFIISASKQGYQDFADVGQNYFAENTKAKNLEQADSKQDNCEVKNPRQIPVYLQPMDEYDAVKNQANIARTLELAARHGCRISLQMHKILGVA